MAVLHLQVPALVVVGGDVDLAVVRQVRVTSPDELTAVNQHVALRLRVNRQRGVIEAAVAHAPAQRVGDDA